MLFKGGCTIPASRRAARPSLRPPWLHEVKYDGYRLIAQRDGSRVRLFTRNGHDWAGRYPWIVENALRNRHKQFVIDGEAVILGVDRIADFNALHSRQRDEEVQLYASTWGVEIGQHRCPLSSLGRNSRAADQVQALRTHIDR